MAPPRKRAKTQAKAPDSEPEPERPKPSALISDNRAGWLVKSDAQSIDLVAKGETLSVHRQVLIKHSEYFARCLREPWGEAYQGVITFDNIEARYLALFVCVAYSHSSLIPAQPPEVSINPQCRKERTPIRDLVEVLKLCDRFLCPKLVDYMVRCLYVAISDGHRAMFKADTDESLHKEYMQDFADGYEACELGHLEMKDLAEKMIEYFCGGITYKMWAEHVEEVLVAQRPRFVGAVSRAFAERLGELVSGRKFRRKEKPTLRRDGW